MNNKQEFYSNFQCYSKKNQRIAVFGRQLNENTLEIFELTCSKSDFFRKDTARHVYAWFRENEPIQDYHPNVFTIRILKKDKPMHTFNQWCKYNYYKKVKRYLTRVFEVDFLEKEKEIPIIIEKSAKRVYKMNKSY